MDTFSFIRKNFSLLIIIGLIIIILLQRACSPICANGEVEIITKTQEIIKKDTVKIKVPVITTVHKKGDTIYQETLVYIDVPTKIDTASILKDCNVLRVYKDTLQLKDSMGYVSIVDSISKNKILARLWTANVNKKTTIDTVYFNKRNNQFYLGGSITLQRPNQMLVGCNVMLKTKTDQIFGLGLGINPRLQPYLQGSVLWKVSFKK